MKSKDIASNVNWVCRYCEYYAGMEDEGKATRCSDPQYMSYFKENKDYFIHYADARPNWCKKKVAFGEDEEGRFGYAGDV